MAYRLPPYTGLTERFIQACAANNPNEARYQLSRYIFTTNTHIHGVKNAAIFNSVAVLCVFVDHVAYLAMDKQELLNMIKKYSDTNTSNTVFAHAAKRSGVPPKLNGG